MCLAHTFVPYRIMDIFFSDNRRNTNVTQAPTLQVRQYNTPQLQSSLTMASDKVYFDAHTSAALPSGRAYYYIHTKSS